MPNWTSNIIRVRGEPQCIRAFLDAVATEETAFDFNRLIPMPELLKRTGYGFRHQQACSWYVVSEGDGKDIPEETRPFTPEEEAALREIGYFNWYEWATANWGTKWNTACVSITSDAFICPDALTIAFDTAWDPPIPVLRKMIDAFPEIHFECSWINEEEPDVQHSLTFPIDDDEDEQ